MSNRSQKAQQRVIEEKMEEMIFWYAETSGGKVPDHVCEDKKTYRGKILRWLEPMLAGEKNPVLIEECLGDVWTLRFEPANTALKV